MTTRRTCLQTALSAATLAGLGSLMACAGLSGTRVVTLDEGELNALVARRFPLKQRLVEVLEVEVRDPRLHLQPERNRLALNVALAVRDRVLGSHRQGNLLFDSALRWERSDQTVRLTQPQVQSLTLDGAVHGERSGGGSTGHSGNTGGSEGPLARLSRALAERMLDELVVYRLSAERQDSLRQRGLVPGAVTVTARGVEITLVANAPATSARSVQA